MNVTRREQRQLRKAFKLCLGALASLSGTTVAACGLEALTTDTSSGGTSTTDATTDVSTASSTSGTTSSQATGGGATSSASGTGGAGGGKATSSSSSSMDPCASSPADAPDGDLCGAYAHFPCGLPAEVAYNPNVGCFLTLNDCSNLCFSLAFNCHVVDDQCGDAGNLLVEDGGALDIDCNKCPGGVGRVPAGLARGRLRRSQGRCSTETGEYFGTMAYLEAASVHAFDRLHAELRHHRAPVRLLRKARLARKDEVVHARSMRRQASRFGCAVNRPVVASVGLRSLEEIAIENAVEGCVKELFGALVAHYQAEHATDPAVATLMRRIAEDETRHAALSLSVARWSERKLERATRERIANACSAAIDALADESEAHWSKDVTDAVGLPGPTERRVMLDALRLSARSGECPSLKGLWDGRESSESNPASS